MKKCVLFLITLTLLTVTNSLLAQGTAFTYQGQLQNNGSPAGGNYDFTFGLFNTNSTNTGQVGSTLTKLDMGVTNGLFTVILDFGANFPGANRWLAIAVRTNGGATFTSLSPLQQLTPTPYAVFAGTASNISGTLSSADLSGTYGNAVTLNNAGNSFTGNGGGLTSLNASQLTGGTVPDAQLSGNVALLNANQTFSGTNKFTGSNQSLIVDATGPVGTNIFTGLGLYYDNNTGESAIMSSFNDQYASLNFYTKPGSGFPTTKQVKIDRYGTLMIDQQNANYGALNDGTTNGAGLVFGTGGGAGIASQRTPGVNKNGLDFYTSSSRQMSILNNGNVGIGTTNPSTALQVAGTVTASAFAGNANGLTNLNVTQLSGPISLAQLPAGVITNGASGVTLTGVMNGNGGGLTNLNANNMASGTVPNSVLSGFQGNFSTVSGGNGNTAGNNEATVGGGLNNTASGQFATVPGGNGNLAGGKYSFAAGRQAQATNQGAFVWDDSQNAPFASTNNDSFNVRAQGGANFVTSGAGLTVDGQAVVTSAGLSGVPGTTVWQVTSGTAVQAQPNAAYLLTNSKKVTVTLPASPNAGDVVEIFGSGSGGWMVAQNAAQSVQYSDAPSSISWSQTSAPAEKWTAITSSSDGTKLAATVGYSENGGIYTSANSGVNWILTSAPSELWSGIASSSDGVNLAATVGGGNLSTGGIYTSTNSGVNWTLTSAPSETWSCIASSADGSHLAASTLLGGIYTSTDSGANWVQTSAPIEVYYSIASSSDGSTLAAAELNPNGGGIYVSTSAGAHWSLTSAPNNGWRSVTCSSDGSHLAAVSEPGGIYISTDSGADWTLTSAPGTYWGCIASSADGDYLTAGFGSYGPIYTSTDSGANWALTSSPATNYWTSIASSSDGTKLVAADGGVDGGQGSPVGGIWKAGPGNHALTTTTGAFGLLGGRAGSGVKIVYAGGGQFVLVNQHGSIYGL